MADIDKDVGGNLPSITRKIYEIVSKDVDFFRKKIQKAYEDAVEKVNSGGLPEKEKSDTRRYLQTKADVLNDAAVDRIRTIKDIGETTQDLYDSIDEGEGSFQEQIDELHQFINESISAVEKGVQEIRDMASSGQTQHFVDKTEQELEHQTNPEQKAQLKEELGELYELQKRNETHLKAQIQSQEKQLSVSTKSLNLDRGSGQRLKQMTGLQILQTLVPNINNIGDSAQGNKAVSTAVSSIGQLASAINPVIQGITALSGQLSSVIGQIDEYNKAVQEISKITQSIDKITKSETKQSIDSFLREIKDASKELIKGNLGDIVTAGNPKNLYTKYLNDADSPAQMAYKTIQQAETGSISKLINAYGEFRRSANDFKNASIERKIESNLPGGTSMAEIQAFDKAVSSTLLPLINSMQNQIQPLQNQTDQWQSVGNITGDYQALSLVDLNRSMLETLESINLKLPEDLKVTKTID